MNLFERFDRLAPGAITTIAGLGYTDGVPARDADAGWPLGVVRLPEGHPHAGELIVNDYQGQRIWRIDRKGILHTFAGDGVPGNRGDDGPASEARVCYPHDLCLDHEGNLYVGDFNCQLFRRIDAKTGVITRVVGSGKRGRGGDGDAAVDAETDTTCGIAVAANGDLYVSSEWSNNIRRVDARTGIITRFAGLDGRHYPLEAGGSRPYGGPEFSLQGYHGDGGPAAAAAFWHPEHLAFDSRGDLYVCDNSNDRIRKIDMTTGIVSTVLGNGQRASNGDGGPAAEASTLMPDALCFDAHDNMYVGEKYGFRIRRVDGASGIVTTLVGTGEPGFGEEGLHGSVTRCNSVESGIWADPDGTVIWGDCSGRTRRYDGANGIVTTLLGGTSVQDGGLATRAFLNGVEAMDVTPDGQIYLADRWNQRVRAIDPITGIIRGIAGNGARAYGGDNGPAQEAYLDNPSHVAIDSRGRVVIGHCRMTRVRRVDEDGIIRTIVGTGQTWDKGDGGPAISACLIHVSALAHGPDDGIYVGDVVGRIRKVDAESGIIDTVAGVGLPGYDGDGRAATSARIGSASGIAFDREGNLFFSDSQFHVIRRIDRQGVITTVAGRGEAGFSPDGTPATEARLDEPLSVTTSSNGLVYFSDSLNNRVRRINRDGRLETVAGNGEQGEAADDIQATSAALNKPHAIRFFDSHVLLISDFFNNKVKALRLAST